MLIICINCIASLYSGNTIGIIIGVIAIAAAHRIIDEITVNCFNLVCEIPLES